MSEQTTRVRASDAEREKVAEVLRHAMSEGRLTLTEGEERLAAVYATTYRDELPPMTADLPPAETAPGRAGRGAPRQHRGRPAIGLVAVAALGVGIWAVTAGGPVWPAILLGVLAVMLAKHSRYGHHNWAHARDHGRGDGRDHGENDRDHGFPRRCGGTRTV